MNYYYLDILHVEDLVRFSDFDASEELVSSADELSN
jgi:hypothetical protein